MRALAGLAALAGCYAPHYAGGSPCSADQPCPSGLTCSAEHSCEAIDASVGIGSDGMAMPGCIGSGLGVDVCFSSPLPQVLDVSSSLAIDTDSDPLCAPGGPSCVIAASAVTITGGATLSATGARPLVIASASTIEVDGAIDVASHRAPAAVGAGADPVGCVSGTISVAPVGGAGGSFGSQGGAGGAFSLDGIPGPKAAPAVIATTVRGGCPGGAGGDTGGAGGHGGGAVYLLAARSISITGTIDASGEGGTGGAAEGAGGGGGAGGLIGLDAPIVTTGPGAEVYANGGGGGAAPESKETANGADPTSPTTAAAGGKASDAATGGDGAFGTTDAIDGGAGELGGGAGGGGGAGAIRVFPPQALAGAVSPPPS
ncbi:MAG TPA: hypothetical protein VLX92_16075 [Kofleriaceae bacterium]|nr:hypothetical protein [Kofleriaceae bacterium]